MVRINTINHKSNQNHFNVCKMLFYMLIFAQFGGIFSTMYKCWEYVFNSNSVRFIHVQSIRIRYSMLHSTAVFSYFVNFSARRTVLPGENHPQAIYYWQLLSHKVVLSTKMYMYLLLWSWTYMVWELIDTGRRPANYHMIMINEVQNTLNYQ